MRPAGLLIPLACAISACAMQPAARPRATAVMAELPAAEAAWRDALKPEDSATIDALPGAWLAARAKVVRANRTAMNRENGLVEPAAALDHPALPPGSYNCRVIRVGGTAGRGGYRVFPEQFCFVRGEPDGKLSFNKQTGSDLPNGWLYPDGDKRYVFLGAQQLKPGQTSLAYGTDRSRDIVGVVERVGPFQWRLVIPRKAPDGLWIYELTPVPNDRQPG